MIFIISIFRKVTSVDIEDYVEVYLGSLRLRRLIGWLGPGGKAGLLPVVVSVNVKLHPLCDVHTCHESVAQGKYW